MHPREIYTWMDFVPFYPRRQINVLDATEVVLNI